MLQQRRDMFYERRAAVEKQIAELQKTLDIIQYKCWYYETACEAGTEALLENMAGGDMPEPVRRGKAALEKSLK